jgi:hypothetical protein
MAVTKEQLEEMNTSVQAHISPILALAGVANPVAAATVFGVDMLFRFVTLGAAIRDELAKAKKDLDTAIRTQELFRLPVEVSLEESVVVSFFTKGACRMVYPLAYEQLAEERQTIVDPAHPRWDEAMETLTVAYRLLPDLYHDCTFDESPMLERLFGAWLDPGNPEFASLFREAKLLVLPPEISIPSLQRLLPSYTRLRLELAGAASDAATAAALAAVNQKIQALVWTTVFGDKGAVTKVTKYAVDRRLEQLNTEIASLEARKAELEAIPEGSRSESQTKELKQVEKRITDRKQMKARIEATQK